MTQLAIGLLLGITTSFIAGLFLTWKAEKIVGFLKRLPEQRRIWLFTRAYILGLQSYPYRFLHYQAILYFGMLLFFCSFVYALMTMASFAKTYGIAGLPAEPDELRDAIRSAEIPATEATPWILLLVTLLMSYASFKIFFRRLMPEALAPYGYHELRRVHDCVMKFGTKKQYVDYMNAEDSVTDNASLLGLLDAAEKAIGDHDVALIGQIRKAITPSSNSNTKSDS